MRNLIWILLPLLFSNLVKSQTGTVISVNATPEHICLCDSSSIAFKWKFNNGETFPNPNAIEVIIYVRLYDYKGGGGIPNQYIKKELDTLTAGEVFQLPKTGSFQDTTYYCKVKIPCNLRDKYGPTDSDILILDMFLNTKMGSVSHIAKDCTVGIDEYYLDPLKPIYFDLYGNRIEKRSNEVITEQMGGSRRKIIIQE